MIDDLILMSNSVDVDVEENNRTVRILERGMWGSYILLGKFVCLHPTHSRLGKTSIEVSLDSVSGG